MIRGMSEAGAIMSQTLWRISRKWWNCFWADRGMVKFTKWTSEPGELFAGYFRKKLFDVLSYKNNTSLFALFFPELFYP